MTIWRIACLITKATDTHWENVIPIAFPRRQWLHKRASVLRNVHTTCLVKFADGKQNDSRYNVLAGTYRGAETQWNMVLVFWSVFIIKSGANKFQTKRKATPAYEITDRTKLKISAFLLVPSAARNVSSRGTGLRISQ